MSYTTIFLEKGSAILKLKDLSDQIPAVQDAIANITALQNDGVLTETETEELVDDYKKQILKNFDKLLNDAKQEAKNISIAAEAEVNNRVKGITPIIMGSPVITPSPLTAATGIATFVSEAARIVTSYTQIINSVNVLR